MFIENKIFSCKFNLSSFVTIKCNLKYERIIFQSSYFELD